MGFFFLLFGQKKTLQFLEAFCGESRIRTYEDVVSRFTVCPRWPLEYLPEAVFGNAYCVIRVQI
jgi:hypothetical protein